MRRLQLSLFVVSVGALLGVLIASGAAAMMATRPRLMRLLGWTPDAERDPTDVGLSFEDVEYQPGVFGWWVSAVEPIATAVIVHGLETSQNPRATDRGPRLELAAALWRGGYSVLVINLGYADGRRPYSAGRLESDDVRSAVEWVVRRAGTLVAIVGMSAGGHSAIAAGHDDESVFAVVTDSAFVDGGQIVVDQAAKMVPIPRLAFALAPGFMRALTGVRPVDLSATTSARCTMLHIHGLIDSAVAVDNARRLSAVTNGEVWIVPDAEHVGAYEKQPEHYIDRVTTFLTNALAKRTSASA